MTRVDRPAAPPLPSADVAAPPADVAAPPADVAAPPAGVDGAPVVGDGAPAGEHRPADPGAPAGWPEGYQYPVVEQDRLTRFVVRLYARAPRWAVPLAAVGCVGLGMAYALVSDPTRSAPDAAPTCLLKLTTGLDCPGCGGTRALWYLLHADLPAAARHHLLFVFSVPFVAYLFVAWAGKQAFGWRLPELRLSPRVLGGFLAVWFAFSVLRNLPWAPFTWFYV
ncbi:DUF2752 domain-containing protein [Micromonospora endolithica]|uniref:DUF2752 domain-containing protein n=1 Tax=Micromonospora endolithica TaxID=230091 RepID=A0A3A9ZNY2_9ACTN|nr:DUF2752 domain-containing protein [Micromonospora endolithica]RKN49246.1 DUF2752 domain-containing protein [Micromonospora endolithica]